MSVSLLFVNPAVPLVAAPIYSPESAAAGPKKTYVRPVLITASLLGGLAWLQRKDGDIRNRLDHEERNFGRRGSLVFQLGQAPGVAAIAGGFYLGGWLGRSEEARQTGVTMVESVLVAAALTQGVRHVAGRDRPLPNEDPDHFRLFGGGDAFPSGHSSTVFSMAAVVTDHYPAWWVQVISYGTAGMVGYSRLLQDSHWASDVAGGAILGIIVGKVISRWERRRRWGRLLYTDGRHVGVVRRWG